MDERDGVEMDERGDPEPAQLSSQGASTDLGPRPGSGGEQEPQGLVPPYEGRQTEAKEGLETIWTRSSTGSTRSQRALAG
jgi:hypothetical protein